MKTQREILKIKAVEQYIISQLGGEVDFMKLFKLLYFAQQRLLVDAGLPLMNDTFKAVPHGPVPSFTYKCFDHQLNDKPMTDDMKNFMQDFHVFVKKIDGKQITFVSCEVEPNMKMLSGVDKQYLDGVIKEYGDKDAIELSKLSHKDKAWIEARNRKQGDVEKNIMNFEDIAEAGGADERVVDYIHESRIIKQAFAK